MRFKIVFLLLCTLFFSGYDQRSKTLQLESQAMASSNSASEDLVNGASAMLSGTLLKTFKIVKKFSCSNELDCARDNTLLTLQLAALQSAIMTWKGVGGSDLPQHIADLAKETAIELCRISMSGFDAQATIGSFIGNVRSGSAILASIQRPKFPNQIYECPHYGAQ